MNTFRYSLSVVPTNSVSFELFFTVNVHLLVTTIRGGSSPPPATAATLPSLLQFAPAPPLRRKYCRFVRIVSDKNAAVLANGFTSIRLYTFAMIKQEHKYNLECLFHMLLVVQR
ncbi:hypothetical protein L1987_16196 [Smallanthus sonchifolius]|uniref:Uncharacterized protein n=1 Tax=Smallanthus sonchifolius TaxID=185202 RepID=A0ACB9J8P1_9ASTR|nr:hypothetical protein L1987_16196 [Smallanthus sonchifolius]